MFGGDEISAVVLDIGSATTKIGYAGEDTPRSNFPSFMGLIEGDDSVESSGDARMEGETSQQQRDRRVFVGDEQLCVRRDHMKLHSPFTDGSVTNWDAYESICNYALKTALRIDPTQHPLLLAESNFHQKKSREAVTEYMFEKLQVPAFFVCKSAVLSAFANGKPNALVIECGASSTSVVPVHDGYALQRASLKSDFGGDEMNRVLLHRLMSKGHAIHPSYEYTKKSGKASVVQYPSTDPSYATHRTMDIIRDIKETTLRVSETYFNERDYLNVPGVPYELPDGTTIEIGTERFNVPEILFNYTHYPSEMDTWTGQRTTIPDMVARSINSCDADIRREMMTNIVLTGGASLFTGLQARLNRELSECLPAHQIGKVKVNSATNPERRFGSWLGGSILGSLGTFHQMWISKLEYEEHGRTVVEKKCP